VGFGHPIRTWIRGKDRTEWAIGAFPLGGYVKMLDEREGIVEASERHRAFNRQSVARRIVIVSAGPVANFLLAILVYWVLFLHGVPGLKPIIADPKPRTPAAMAGFAGGETIVEINQKPVRTFQDLRWRLLEHAVAHEIVQVETQTERGEINFRKLDLSTLKSADLDGDFLEKLGFDRFEPATEAVVGAVMEGRVAARAGIRVKDRISAIDGKAVRTWSDLVAAVSASADREIIVTVERSGEQLSIALTPERTEERGKSVGKIGIAPQVDESIYQRLTTKVKYGPGEALWQAAARTWETSIITLKMLGKMVIGEVSLKNLSGPITIADYAGQSAQMGWLPYLTFIALISISLGVLNLLPVPLLDGGHLLYYLIEVLKGSPVSERTMELGQRAGMVLLFALMAFALYNDIHRLVGGS
jgi:regulator of sigma E protease